MDGHDDDNEHIFGLNRRDHLDELRQKFAGIYPPDADFVVLAHAHQRVREHGYDPAIEDTWPVALVAFLNVDRLIKDKLQQAFVIEQLQALANPSGAARTMRETQAQKAAEKRDDQALLARFEELIGKGYGIEKACRNLEKQGIPKKRGQGFLTLKGIKAAIATAKRQKTIAA